jgi:hypothetical protein
MIRSAWRKKLVNRRNIFRYFFVVGSGYSYSLASFRMQFDRVEIAKPCQVIEATRGHLVNFKSLLDTARWWSAESDATTFLFFKVRNATEAHTQHSSAIHPPRILGTLQNCNSNESNIFRVLRRWINLKCL